MPVASKSPVSSQKPQTASSRQTVQFAQSRSKPIWLIRLCHLQQRFCAVSWLLMFVTVSVYGSTGFFLQKWNQANGELKYLQLEERQLKSTNEVIKYDLVQQAGKPNSGLVRPNPAEAIVLQPESGHFVPANKSTRLIDTSSAQNNQSTSLPIGY